ncbi:hypothetical protein [Streptomyces ipomoeae]|uniref:LexA family protein n=1 Tax=Streptomyces ipomoeae TaxID=103232 RepID=UPI0011476927|nr:hypothetical protein [Streptomyces ipomoeae]MDX2935982.1 hypothetical protein [Streptomyces ipomoeae]TQE14757.1 hypothetical protein SipoB123_45925 [Streptomyces ipomoeae]
MSEITAIPETEGNTPSPAEAELTDRQRKVLTFIREAAKVRGFAPSLREIGEAVGLASTSSVHYQLKQLQEKGLVTTPDPRLPRAYRVTDGSPAQGVPALRHIGCPLLASDTEEKETDRAVVLKVVLEPAIRRALLAGAQLTVQQLPVTDGDARALADAVLLGQVTAVSHPLSITHAPPEAAAGEASSN